MWLVDCLSNDLFNTKNIKNNKVSDIIDTNTQEIDLSQNDKSNNTNNSTNNSTNNLDDISGLDNIGNSLDNIDNNLDNDHEKINNEFY